MKTITYSIRIEFDKYFQYDKITIIRYVNHKDRGLCFDLSPAYRKRTGENRIGLLFVITLLEVFQELELYIQLYIQWKIKDEANS